MPVPSDELFDYYRAIDNNDIDTMSKIIAERFGVNNVDYLLDSPLNHAIASNAIKSMKFLIEAGADINDGVKGRPLEIALRWGTLEAVKILLESGVDIYLKDSSGATYLHDAALSNDLKKLNLIIPYFRDDINILDNMSYTAIMYGAAADADMSIKELWRNGANLDMVGSDGITALMAAAVQGAEKAVRVLLELGANLSIAQADKNYAIHFMTGEAWQAIRPHFPDINKKHKFQFLRTLNDRRYMNIILQMLLDLHSDKNQLLSFLDDGDDEYKDFRTFYGKLARKNRLQKIMAILKKFPEYREIDKEEMAMLDAILREE